AAEHRRGNGRAVRAGRHPRGGAGRDRRDARGFGAEPARQRAARRRPRPRRGAESGRRIRQDMNIDRRTYADHYGPTTGDRIRLADTDLIIRIEHDAAVYGDEAKFGGGKVIRDGMGQSPTASRESGSPDLVITNVVIVDASGIRKADVGIRDGRISAIGKSGNPGIMDGVSDGLVIGASTE